MYDARKFRTQAPGGTMNSKTSPSANSSRNHPANSPADPGRRDFLSATAAAVTLSGALPALASASPVPAPVPPAEASAIQAQSAPTTGNAAYAAPTEIRTIEIINLREMEGAAQKLIPSGGFGFISSAAGDEWTKRENEASFKRVTIAPHYLSGNLEADRSTTLLGTKISMPIIVSPMAGHGLAHASAEAGTAKGAAEAGTIFVAATLGNLTLEETSKASAGPKWFQIYMPADRGIARELLQRARDAGYLAMMLTIDDVVGSNRETDARNHFRTPLPTGNFSVNAPYAAKHNLGWDDVEFIGSVTGRPVLLKGVLSPEMAADAVKHGCAGIQVSNHGGRQLDDVPGSFTALPRIVDAVRGRIPILLDGGVRRGQDVFKVLAMGGQAVALGRPVLYGLALGGWKGVDAVLKHLDTELEMTMRLAGAKSVAEISRSYLTTPA